MVIEEQTDEILKKHIEKCYRNCGMKTPDQQIK